MVMIKDYVTSRRAGCGMEMLRQENLNLSLGNRGQKKYLAKLSRFIPRRLAMVVEEKGG